MEELFRFFNNGSTILAECINTITDKKIKISVQDNNIKAAKEIFQSLLEIDNNETLQVSIDEINYVVEKKLRTKIESGDLEIETSDEITHKTEMYKFLYRNKIDKKFNQLKMTKSKAIKLFVSYSNKDSDLQKLLIKGVSNHLGYKEAFNITFWTDQAIDIGDDWKKSIEENIGNSNGAIILMSANFTSSEFINKIELAEFLRRKTKEGFLILPVVVRNFDFSEFEKVSFLQFFKTYYKEYGFNKPIHRDNFLAFDVLAENDNTTDKQLQDYYQKLADRIYQSIKIHFGPKSGE